MRITNLLCSFALLTLAGTSTASAETIDPNSDFDCSVTFEFFHRVAKAKQAPADLLEEVLIMGLWFETKWNQEHPGEDARRSEHFFAMLKDLGDNPKAHRDTLNSCSERANADPVFNVFATELRKSAPAKP
ncbi:MAG: hypothetical protein HOP96_02890 [Sphingomonas sp.]|nr:hypothetical protein [Sphingomonas sp.]